MTGSQVLFVAAPIAGLLLGLLLPAARENEPKGDTEGPTPQRRSVGLPVPATVRGAPVPERGELAECLLLEGGERYRRMGLWLSTATSGEAARAWDSVMNRRPVDPRMQKLVMAAWVRVDPLAAVREVEGTDLNWMGWRAWAMHDHDAAWAAAKEEGGLARAGVLWWMAERDPEWAQEILRDHPELGSSVRQSIAMGLVRHDPEAAMEMVRRMGPGAVGGHRVLKMWLHQDAKAAAEWVADGGHFSRDPNDQAWKEVVGALEREHPELLSDLAGRMEPGERKRRLEAAAFRKQASSDPELALAEGRKEDSDVVAVARMAEAALHLSGAEARFSVLEEMVQRMDDPTEFATTTVSEGARSNRREQITEARDLVQNLMEEDPARTMELLVSEDDGSWPETATRNWARGDLDGFSAWLGEQAEGPSRDRAYLDVSRMLSVDGGRREEALSWGVRVRDEQLQRHALDPLIREWAGGDAAAAESWVHGADLSEPVRAHLLNRVSERKASTE